MILAMENYPNISMTKKYLEFDNFKRNLCYGNRQVLFYVISSLLILCMGFIVGMCGINVIDVN